MAFCAICGRHHSADGGCYQTEVQGLPKTGVRDAAGKIPGRTSGERFRGIAKHADRFMLKLLLLFLALLILAMVLQALQGKLY